MKYTVPVVLSILIGILMAKFVLNQYDMDESVKTVFNSGEQLYFVSIGSYNTEAEMNIGIKDLPYYIYTKDNTYDVYMGITKTASNASKLEEFFKEKKYSTSVKKLYVDNDEFTNLLDQYDMLLDNTDDTEVIDAICKQIINKYKETVLDEN